MMARFAISCNRCGAKVVTTSMAEALTWNDSHDAVCVALPVRNDS